MPFSYFVVLLFAVVWGGQKQSNLLSLFMRKQADGLTRWLPQFIKQHAFVRGETMRPTVKRGDIAVVGTSFSIVFERLQAAKSILCSCFGCKVTHLLADGKIFPAFSAGEGSNVFGEGRRWLLPAFIGIQSALVGIQWD